MKNIILNLIFINLFWSNATAYANLVTIANSAEKVNYSFTSEFRSITRVTESEKPDAFALANFHAEHLYGLFHSADYVTQYKEPAELYEGFAGTKKPQILTARLIKKSGDAYYWVQYSAAGEMLVLNSVLKKWLNNSSTGQVALPLLYDLPLVYLDNLADFTQKKFKKCTDPNYQTPIDFSYFYTPYICEELRTEPIAKDVTLEISRTTSTKAMASKMPITKLRSNNENGKLLTLYYVFGFDGHLDSESLEEEIKKDYGWKNFKNLHKELEINHGFSLVESTSHYRELLGASAEQLELLTPVTLTHMPQRRFFNTHVLHTDDITIVVRSALFDTSNETGYSPLVSFPKFWKEALENGDFIYYGGHSGDGAALDLASMTRNLEKTSLSEIEFKQNKEQVLFLDACSSFSHFLEMYHGAKPRGLHIMSYGVVSLYHLAETTVDTTLHLFLENKIDLNWITALKKIEEAQLEPHIRFLYYKDQAGGIIEKYRKKNQYPSMLLNVSVSSQ